MQLKIIMQWFHYSPVTSIYTHILSSARLMPLKVALWLWSLNHILSAVYTVLILPVLAFHSTGVLSHLPAQRASSATLASSPRAEMVACAVWLLLSIRWTLCATAAWATQTDCVSLPPITCALAPCAETEARVNSPASTVTSVNAHQAGQVRPQSS